MFQSFDVTIATPPVILNGFTSKEESLGYYVSFNCNVTGNPKPIIEWYRNGELIHDDWIVNYKEPKLLIQTFEEKHKGVYQCVAKNPMGEIQATGLLSLKQKTYTDPPKNVKCFPISLNSFKITFEGPEHFKVSHTYDFTSNPFLFLYINCFHFFSSQIVVGNNLLHIKPERTEMAVSDFT